MPHAKSWRGTPSALADLVGQVVGLTAVVAKPTNTSDADNALGNIATPLASVADAVANVLKQRQETAAQAAAAAAAAFGSVAKFPITATAALFTADCAETEDAACSAVYHATNIDASPAVIDVLVQTPGGAFYSTEDVYHTASTR